MANQETDYYQSFGLDKDPFPEVSADNSIYLTPEINRRLKQAKQHISVGDTLLLISSVPGSGKSLLAEKLLVLKEGDWRTCFVPSREQQSAEDLAFEIIEGLAPGTCENKKTATSLLHKFLETSYKEEITPVIVIDDAHRLPLESLQLVLQLSDLRYQESLFRFVLFANDSIAEILEKPGLRELKDGAIEYFSMPFFNQQQVAAYIKYRFSSCGDDVDHPFDEEDLAYIYKASAGLPEGINILARDLMIKKAAEPEGTGTSSGLNTFLILLVIFLAGYLYYDNYHTTSVVAESGLENRTDGKSVGKELLLENETATTDVSSPTTILAGDMSDDFLSLKLSEFISSSE